MEHFVRYSLCGRVAAKEVRFALHNRKMDTDRLSLDGCQVRLWGTHSLLLNGYVGSFPGIGQGIEDTSTTHTYIRAHLHVVIGNHIHRQSCVLDTASAFDRRAVREHVLHYVLNFCTRTYF